MKNFTPGQSAYTSYSSRGCLIKGEQSVMIVEHNDGLLEEGKPMTRVLFKNGKDKWVDSSTLRHKSRFPKR